jgi:DNA-binding XRE family transcriptional regulator
LTGHTRLDTLTPMRGETIPNRVKDLRVRRLWTQRQLAVQADVHEWTIRQAEQGKPVSALTRERIARAFGKRRETVFPEDEKAVV